MKDLNFFRSVATSTKMLNAWNEFSLGASSQAKNSILKL